MSYDSYRFHHNTFIYRWCCFIVQAFQQKGEVEKERVVKLTTLSLITCNMFPFGLLCVYPFHLFNIMGCF